MSSATVHVGLYLHPYVLSVSICKQTHSPHPSRNPRPLGAHLGRNSHLLLKPEAPVRPSFRKRNPRVSSHVTPAASGSGAAWSQSWAGSWSVSPPLKSIGRGCGALHLCPSIQRRDQSGPGHRCPAMAVAVGPVKATIRKDSLSWGVCVCTGLETEVSLADFPGGPLVRNPPADAGTRVRSLVRPTCVAI